MTDAETAPKLPSIDELVASSDWEARLEEARRRRHEVLARKGRTEPAAGSAEPRTPPLRLVQPQDNAVTAETPDHAARWLGARIVAAVTVAAAFGFGAAAGMAVLMPDGLTGLRPVEQQVMDSAGSEGERTAMLRDADAQTSRPAARPGAAIGAPAQETAMPDAVPPEAVDEVPLAAALPPVELPTSEPFAGRPLHVVAGEDAERALRPLRDAGFDVRRVSPSLAPTVAEVRYFHPEDRAVAEAAADRLGSGLRDYSTFRPRPPRGRIELLLPDA